MMMTRAYAASISRMGKAKGEQENTLENGLVVENKCRAARTVQDYAIK